MVSYLLCVTISSMKQLSIETAKDGSILLEQDGRAALDELSQLEQVGRDTAGTSKWQGRSVGRSAGREGGREGGKYVGSGRPSSVVRRRPSSVAAVAAVAVIVAGATFCSAPQTAIRSSVIRRPHSQSVSHWPSHRHSLTHSFTHNRCQLTWGPLACCHAAAAVHQASTKHRAPRVNDEQTIQ